MSCMIHTPLIMFSSRSNKMEDKMKAPIKIVSLITAGILACGLVGCGGNNDNESSAADTTENTESAAESAEGDEATSDDATDDAEDEFENGYVECDGEKIGIYDWSQMISTNPLSMDTYIGKEITVESDFMMITSGNQYYYESYEASKSTSKLPPSYEPPVGVMVLTGTIYVDIPEADQAMVSSLKQGDKVKVTGTISGFSYGATYLFTPTAGTAYTGDITIEKVS